jgi:hypothetical protein
LRNPDDYAKARAEKLRPLVETLDARANQPLELECALEVARVGSADLEFGGCLVELAPVGAQASDHLAFVVGQHLGHHLVGGLHALEFRRRFADDHARARPRELHYAIDGSAIFQSVVGQYFTKRAGIELVEVGYRSTAQALQDTVSGITQCGER